jgi:two-component system NtrC family sensor kinase
MKFYHTLRFRVLAGTILLLVAIFGIASFYTIRYHAEQMMELVLQSATRMSEVISKSTHYSMLLDRREDAYKIITTIGEEPGVVGIRILNKRGQITFSTDKREEHSRVNMDAEQCFACHQKGKPLESLPITNRARLYPDTGGVRVLGLIEPIKNEPSCVDAACHAHSAEQTVLGVLDVRVSLAEVDKAAAAERTTFLQYASACTAGSAAIVAGFFFFTVLRPVRKLNSGMKQISAGNLEYSIDVHAGDEIGDLARGFNEMAVALLMEKDENSRWSQTLEERVNEKTEELRQIHERILQIEKMVSLGKLSATVAHELNNPLEGVYTYAKLIIRRIKRAGLEEQNRSTIEDLELIVHEIDRCGTIVKNLLMFSKRQVGELGIVDLHVVVDRAHRLVQHHLQLANVTFKAELNDKDAEVLGDEQQLQQALVALIVNAVEAITGGGSIAVQTHPSPETGFIELKVSDTGGGIAKEDLPHIFEPFYSTKQNGKGVGLGLSVVYGIIERHKGKIRVESTFGIGTTFIITLPRAELSANEPAYQPEQLQGNI